MIKTQNYTIGLGFISIAILCFLLATAFESKILFLVPFALLLTYISILDYSFLYYLLFASIPFSIELYLPNGLGTDLPTEPLMLILTGISILLVLFHVKKIKAEYIKHPILVLLIVHISWIFIVSITSVNPTVSYKFFLAKLWYVIPFYFLSLHLLNNNKKIYQWINVLVISISIMLIYVNVRHASYGFSFEKMNRSVAPFFRNHVNYAALLAIFFPFIMVLYQKTKSKIYLLTIVLVLWSIYFSYTRAAYVTIIVMPFIFYIIKWKKLKLSVWLGIICIPFIVMFFTEKNNYLNYAPDFEKTIMNYEFDDLLAATYKMEDLSTMERVYRWVAGGRMIGEHPVLGFGPATFYRTYKGYVVTDFETYVSDNPDKSGIHNYFLMTTVEQGVIGFLIFLILISLSLIYGQRIYHETTNLADKNIIMASILSLVSIVAILLINDMLESDKLGPFFFVNLALLTHFDIKNKRQRKNKDDLIH